MWNDLSENPPNKSLLQALAKKMFRHPHRGPYSIPYYGGKLAARAKMERERGKLIAATT